MSESKTEENKELTDREKEMAEQIANLTQDKENLTAEIKTVRTQKQEAEKSTEKKEEKKEEVNGNPEEIVRKVLAERDKEGIATAKVDAKESVRGMFQEFSPSNDEAGIAFAKLESEAKKFSFDGLTTKDQIVARYKEVYEFMNRNKQQSKPENNTYKGTSSGTGGEPKADEAGNLSASEAKLVKEKGWTKEQFMTQKAKRPHYINSLLKWMN